MLGEEEEEKKKIFSFLLETTNKSRVCAMEIIQQHRPTAALLLQL
jgi:hypothetical protein